MPTPTDEQELRKPSIPRKWIVVTLIATSVLSAAVLVGMALTAFMMIRNGRGQESFRTAWLVEYDWNGMAVLIVGTVGAITAAGVYRWLHDYLEVRQLERKYGNNRKGR
jgi:hypothetical protein